MKVELIQFGINNLEKTSRTFDVYFPDSSSSDLAPKPKLNILPIVSTENGARNSINLLNLLEKGTISDYAPYVKMTFDDIKNNSLKFDYLHRRNPFLVLRFQVIDYIFRKLSSQDQFPVSYDELIKEMNTRKLPVTKENWGLYSQELVD